jgi:hypothetical protein
VLKLQNEPIFGWQCAEGTSSAVTENNTV